MSCFDSWRPIPPDFTDLDRREQDGFVGIGKASEITDAVRAGEALFCAVICELGQGLRFRDADADGNSDPLAHLAPHGLGMGDQIDMGKAFEAEKAFVD